MTDAQKTSHGVQQLIDRLRDEGVESGRREADVIIEQARQQAAAILAQAEQGANALREAARREVETGRRALQDALQLAGRDAILALKEAFARDFAQRVRQLLRREMLDPDFLRQLVLQIAGRAAPDDLAQRQIEIRLPALATGLAELQLQHPDTTLDALNDFVAFVAREQLRAGVNVVAGTHRGGGIRVQMVGEDLELDLSERAVADLLLEHLLPRYRAALDGIVYVPESHAGAAS